MVKLCNRCLCSGFITLECMIALGLCALTTVSAFAIIHQAQNNISRIDRLQNALRSAENTPLDFSQQNSVTHDNNQAAEIVVTRIDSFTKKVAARITPDGLSSAVELSSLTTDPRAEGQSGCDISLNANWDNPRIVGSLTLAQNQTFTDVQIKGAYAYAASSASGSWDPNFYVIDISDESHPHITASLRTGTARTNNSLHVIPRYAFVAASSSRQLQILGITDGAQPRVAATYKMPGVTVVGGSGVGSAVYFYHDMLFIGLTKAVGPEFFVLDVSDPLHPRSLGSLEINATVNNILALDSKVYITATSGDHLQLIDIALPSSPKKISAFSPPDTHHTGMSLAYSSDTLFLGRNIDAIGMKQSQKNEFFSFTDTDVIQPPLTSLHIGGSVNAIVASLPTFILATNVSGQELQFWNMSDMHTATRVSTLKSSGEVLGVECSGQTVIAASNDKEGKGVLSIIHASQ